MSGQPVAMEVLRREHANMSLLLDLLEDQIAAVRKEDSADFALVGTIVDYFLTYPDLVHHPKEDLLFHRLQNVDPAAAIKAESLLSSHEDLGLLARRVGRAMVDHLLQGTSESRTWFVSFCQEFVDMNRRHMAEEEKHFFPLTLKVLSEADWAAVDRRFAERDDPLFGSLVADRFQSLHRFLAERSGQTA